MKTTIALLLLTGLLTAQDPGSLQQALAGGSAEQLAAVLRQLVAQAGDPASRDRLLTRAEQGAGRSSRSGVLLEALALLPDEPVTLYHRAGLAVRLKLLRRADEALRRLSARDPDGPLVLARRAELAFLRFDHRKAARLAARSGDDRARWAAEQARLADSLDGARVRQWVVIGVLVLLTGLGLRRARRIAES